jgi:prevent-host-death family protein
MLNLSQNIDSLSNFKRKTTTFLKQMKKTGEPVILTINGKAELVVQDAASYQRFLRMAELQESLEILRKSLEDVRAGRTQPMRAAVEALGKRK